MMKVGIYYVIFTPLSTWWFDPLVKLGINEYIVLGMTLLANFFSEFLVYRFIVFGKTINTSSRAKPPSLLVSLMANEFGDEYCPMYMHEEDDAGEERNKTFHLLTQGMFEEEMRRIEHLDWYFQLLFEAHFDESVALSVMNVFFYLLLANANTYHPTRSYAWELMRILGVPLLRELELQVEPFIELFRRFVGRVAARNALVDVTERPKGEALKKGLFEIKPSAFFLQNVHFDAGCKNY